MHYGRRPNDTLRLFPLHPYRHQHSQPHQKQRRNRRHADALAVEEVGEDLDQERAGPDGDGAGNRIKPEKLAAAAGWGEFVGRVSVSVTRRAWFSLRNGGYRFARPALRSASEGGYGYQCFAILTSFANYNRDIVIEAYYIKLAVEMSAFSPKSVLIAERS